MQQWINPALVVIVAGALAGCVDDPTTPGNGHGALLLHPRFNSAAPPPLDAVDVSLDGPTDTTVSLVRSGGFFEGTIAGLQPGSYNILLLGRASGGVTYFGETAGVQVTAGETADAAVPFNAFVPDLIPPPALTTAFRFPISFSTVDDAAEYIVESADNPNFTDAVSTTVADTSGLFTVDNIGDRYFRVRAGNSTVPSANAAPSDGMSVRVRGDDRGNNAAGTAFALGAGFAVNGLLTGNNIHPTGESDWYRVSAPTPGLVLITRVRAESLDPSSPLDPIVEVRDGTSPGTVLAQNDNVDGTTLDAGVTVALPAAGDYLIVVRSATGSPPGHYDLETFLTTNNAVASVAVDPDALALRIGETSRLGTTLTDANGVELFGRSVTWNSSNNGIASVDADGLITAVANGTATITANSEGVSGTSTVTVTDAVPAVNAVVFTPGGLSTEVGAPSTMRAEARTFDGQLIPSAEITFSTLNGAVATVTPGGTGGQVTVTGTGIGQTAVVATAGGTVGYGLVTVTRFGLPPLERWEPMQSGTTTDLYDVWAAASSDIHAVGASGVQRRYNGSGWVDETLGSAAILYGVFGLGPANVWAAGFAPADADNGVLQYDGNAWSFFGSAPANRTRGVWAASPGDIFLVDQNGPGIARFDGSAWNTETATGATNGRLSIWGTSAKDVWAAGFQGEIVRFDGTTWSLQPALPMAEPHGLWGSRATNVIAVGTGTSAIRFDGASWITMPLPFEGQLNAVWGRASNDVYAVGSRGTIAHFDGAEWSVQRSGADEDLNGIAGTPDGDIYIVGASGTILKGRLPQPLTLTNIAAGYQLACAVAMDGTPYCWGDDRFGQLGNGDPLAQDSIPNLVSGGLSFTQVVVAGGGETGQGYHACGLTETGAAYCWGRDFFGQLGDGTSGDQSTQPTLVTGGRTFTSLTAGVDHTCGLDTNRLAWCWGNNSRGQLGNGSSSPPVPTPQAVAGSIAWLEISAGHEHTCGVAQADGAAYCWGSGAYGQIGDQGETDRSAPTAVFGAREYLAITAGDRHTCAIDVNNDAWCWGWNDNGQLGVISQPDQCLGTLACELAPVQVNTAEQFATISAGNRFTCGVNPAGAGLCWGQNSNGSLGTGNPNDQSSPTFVAGALTFTVIRAGRNNACGLTTDGRGYCWGTNGVGELGNNSTQSSGVPVAIYEL